MISDLSDDLLLEILSSLPARDMVGTMLLSKRWKFLWTMVTKLHFDDSFKDYYYDDEDEDYVTDGEKFFPYRRFRQYVDKFMILHKSYVLETLTFELGLVSRTDDLATWIRIAIARQVRELEIHRSNADKNDYSFTLPLDLYTYDKLVVLKLCGSIVLDVPSVVSLSSLKSLHLLSVLLYHDEESHRRLLKGCPVLEELVVDKSENFDVSSLYVLTPFLKSLSIVNEYNRQLSTVEHPKFDCYVDVINVPCLKYLNYVDIYDFGHSCLCENMPEVVEANVKLVCKFPEKLMRSLTSVKRLSLCLHGPMRKHRIKYNQLVHLELCRCSIMWLDLLTRMLESSPKLQVLKLNKCQEPFYDSPIKPIKGRWEPSSVPECLVSHLKIVEWKYYNGRHEEKKVVAYILKHARHLKTATVSAQELSTKIPTPQREELVSLPRASASCKLVLD
ncbi:PREDICTED: putative FBD-associated F-box protein At3g50710 [Camelina sativa]|uniref:FBD-associated F-box protein At3g50710 n=1 Tax=Camelina sativa TaxID=90675 RepID=A0ABM0WVD8_CAMSA|nr:PREDICTED: putative FBD-associated F-box protein At3g50710 [Camelina sativa]